MCISFIKHQYNNILTHFYYVLSYIDTAYREIRRLFPLILKRAVSMILCVNQLSTHYLPIIRNSTYLHSFMV